jgi:hypothetical protein
MLHPGEVDLRRPEVGNELAEAGAHPHCLHHHARAPAASTTTHAPAPPTTHASDASTTHTPAASPYGRHHFHIQCTAGYKGILPFNLFLVSDDT